MIKPPGEQFRYYKKPGSIQKNLETAPCPVCGSIAVVTENNKSDGNINDLNKIMECNKCGYWESRSITTHFPDDKAVDLAIHNRQEPDEDAEHSDKAD